VAIIPVRLSDDEVRQIDMLAKRSGYSSRSGAIRKILQEHFIQKLSEDEDVSDLVESLMKLSSRQREPVRLRFKKSVTETVAEARA
jgi:metal-responsive CopG/Arc/MetJ family transcriptional regulator